MGNELSKLKVPRRAKKSPKRVGRGDGSGHGKTCGRGHKGMGARAGSSRKWGFEGGQMPMQRRIPKRGFRNIFQMEYSEVNLRDIVRKFDAGTRVDGKTLKKARLVRSIFKPIKVIGTTEVDKPLSLYINAITRGAREKIERSGGKVEVI